MTFPAPPRLCPACGTGNPAFATFCHECGEPLAAPVASGPAADRDRGRRWEIWLGLALVVGVLGFALFDWAQREIQARQYHAGEEASAARHWDAAEAAFAALGTYRDAPTRRAAAAAQIAARNRAYQVGLIAADPIVAAIAFSRTLAIEPDYRQAPARYAAAAREVAHAALAETVYRRVSGGPPGLYLYQAAGGDVRLPGSDERSLLRGFGGPDGPLVYDGPIPGVTPYPVPLDASPDAYNIPPLAADRQLLLVDGATWRAGASVTPRPLPAALGIGGQLLANDQVVWSPAGFTPPPRFQLGFVHGSTLDKSYAYDLVRDEGGDLSYPGAEPYVILDMNGASRKGPWLLGQYRGARYRPYQTTLYLLGADGARLQPVAVVPGIVYDAQLSADGQYLLYTVSAADGNQPDLPLDLVLRYLPDSTQAGQVLATASGGTEDTRAALQGQFVPGDGPPRILIRRVLPDARRGNQVQLDLWSLTDGAGRIIWRGPPAGGGPGYTAEIYWLAPDGTSLLIPQLLGNGAVQLIWQAFDQSRSRQHLPLPNDVVPDDPVESWVPVFPGTMLPDDYGFYYFVNRYNSQANAADTLIYGVPARDPAPPPVLLYTSRGGTDPSTSIDLLPSRLLVVQQADDSLQLRTPDGSLQLPALPGVDLITPIPARPLYPPMLYPWGY